MGTYKAKGNSGAKVGEGGKERHLEMSQSYVQSAISFALRTNAKRADRPSQNKGKFQLCEMRH